jgi:RNA polymerase sigma-70 factor (ECF subfamily)
LPDDLEPLLQAAFRHALALTHDRHRAEDLVQEACLRLLRARGRWIPAYLHRCVNSAWVDRHRRSPAGELVPLVSGDDDGARAHAALVTEPALPLDARGLERALGELRPVERQALVLAAVEGYTTREIARMTGRPLGTVASLLHRARRQLRAALFEPARGGDA